MLLGLLLLAVAVRLPYLADVPRITDEADELSVALPLAKGLEFPLTNDDAYVGPLLVYAWAAAFVVAGPSLAAARSVSLIAGVITVLLTYLLGKELHSRRAGLVAAALFATNPLHVIVLSHVAWSSCATPLFTLAGLLLLVRSARSGSPRGAALSGLAFGLAIQTHISGIAFALAAAVAVPFLRSRRPTVAMIASWAAGGALGYSNMIFFNLAHDFASVREAVAVAQTYNKVEPLTAMVLADRLTEAVGRLLAITAGAVGGRGAMVATVSAAPWLHVGAVLLAIGYALVDGLRFPVVWTSAALLMLAIVNRKYDAPLDAGRYLMPLVPVIAVVQGAALVDGARALRRRLPERRPFARALIPGLVAGAPVLLVGLSIVAIMQFHERALEHGATNQQLASISNLIADTNRPEDPVLLDGALAALRTDGGGCYLNALGLLLAFKNVSYQVLPARAWRLDDIQRRDGQVLVAVHRQSAADPRERSPWVVRATTPRMFGAARPPSSSITYFRAPRSLSRPGERPGVCRTERMHPRLDRSLTRLTAGASPRGRGD